ncbi:MAG: 50S ribosomal protein L21 [Alkalispirochaeta sp.]|jgi:large subunit ribosomal protein L21
MYALVEIKGKQYRVEKDSVLTVDRLEGETGSNVEFENVVLLSKDDAVSVGTPFVKGASVTAEIDNHIRDRKVMVLKHKRRKNYRRTRGHRQQYSVIRVKEIVGS